MAKPIRNWVDQGSLPTRVGGHYLITKLLEAKRRIAEQRGIASTLLAVCPTSQSAVIGTVRAAKAARAPLIFCATLNQVDIDGGYTGWTPATFVSFVHQCIVSQRYDGPLIIGLDHAGPGLKDSIQQENLPHDEIMKQFRNSIRECLLSGYDLVYVDANGCRRDGEVTVDRLVELTVNMVGVVNEIAAEITPDTRIGYEMGSEDSGNSASDQFYETFLSNLRRDLQNSNLSDVWPVFTVGDVTTRLHTTEFASTASSRLAEIASRYGTALRVHNTDWVARPELLPAAGAACANIGPEVAATEYNALKELEKLEHKTRGSELSRVTSAIRDAVIHSGRWEKWRLPSERGVPFDHLTKERQEWLVSSGARYVWSSENVVAARRTLSANLAVKGIDADGYIADAIQVCVQRYYKAFESVDLLNNF